MAQWKFSYRRRVSPIDRRTEGIGSNPKQATAAGNTGPKSSKTGKAFVVAEHFGLIGGGAKAPLLLAQELQKLGLKVTVFTGSLLFGESPVPGDIEIRTPRVNRGWRFKFPLRSLARQVRNEVWRRNPDLVVVCGVTDLAGFLLGMDCAKRLMIWEFSNASPGNPLVNWKAARLLNRSRAVLSPSSTIDKNIGKNYGFSGELFRLSFWVKASDMEDSIKNAKKRWDFIFLGRKDKDKGLSELLEATASVKSEWPDVRVLIAGPGDVEEYKNLATRLGMSKNVIFEFFGTEEKTLMALATSRFLVLPSYHEGYPLVILEAAALGVPFIATDVGSVPEMVGTSSAAAIVPARDADSLGTAMLTALSIEEGIYSEKRCAARRLFSRLSGQRKVAQQVANLVRFAGMASKPNHGKTGL